MSWMRDAKAGRWRTGRISRRALTVALSLLAIAASVAVADNYDVAAQWLDTGGVVMPNHAITRVYVHDLGGSDASCEDALNGGWQQDRHYCASGGGATYHDFCGCVGRQGWIGARSGTEDMDGHENY
jgi:hypothetical protein